MEEAPTIAVDLIELAVPPAPGLFLERRRERADEALEAIVELWDRLPAESQTLALSVGGSRWSQAIGAVLHAPGGIEESRSAARLAARLGEPALAGALVKSLSVADAEARAAGEAGLLGLALRATALDTRWLAAELGEAPAALDLLHGQSEAADSSIGSVERAALESHLADAAFAFAGHQRRLVLLAALAALDLDGLSRARRDEGAASGAARLVRLLQEPSHVAHRALRQVVRWSGAPLVRARAVLLLTEASIADAAAERLTRADDVLEHEAVLALEHLCRRPRRRRLLREIKVRGRVTSGATEAGQGSAGARVPVVERGGAVPDEGGALALSDAGAAGLCGWLRLVDADDGVRGALVEPMVERGDPGVRLAALGTLGRAGLGHFCFDADPGIARSALLRWSTAGFGLRARAEGGERLRLARLLTRSPHPAVRRLAAGELERESPWMCESSASRASAWRLALRDRDAFLTRLREMIRAGAAGGSDPHAVDAAIAAIGMARRLGLVRLLGPDLATLIGPGAGDGEIAPGRLAATAASALGDVDDAIGRAALRRALTHADDRVRANAVESIGVQRLAIEDATTGRDRDYGVLIELKGDPHHRVRANAIRALLGAPPATPKERRAARRGSTIEGKARVYEPAAVDALAAMLRDDRPMHRLAGAWLAGRVLPAGRERLGESWSRLGTMVAEMGTSDPDGLVRRRAALATARVAGGVRAGWAGAERGGDAILSLEAAEAGSVGGGARGV